MTGDLPKYYLLLLQLFERVKGPGVVVRGACSQCAHDIDDFLQDHGYVFILGTAGTQL